MSSKSDKSLVLKTVAVCIVAILVFTFAWAKQFFHNLDNWVFTLIEGGLIAFFIVESIGAYRYADDPNKEWKRVVVVVCAVALCAWAGGWAAGNNERKAVQDDSNKAKHTSFIQKERELFHLVTPEEKFVRNIVWLENSAVVFWSDGRSSTTGAFLWR